MIAPHLVVAIGPYDEEPAGAGAVEEAGEKVEASLVGPLQVVEEENERGIAFGEHANESDEVVAQARAGAERVGLGRRLAPSDEESELGDEAGEESRVGTHRPEHARAPQGGPFASRGEDERRKRAEGGGERRVGPLAEHLVEFAREREGRAGGLPLHEAARERGLAASRGTRDEHERVFTPARGLVRPGERGGLVPAAVKLAGEAKLRRAVAVGPEARNAPGAGVGVEAARQVVSQCRGRGVALLGRLGEELNDDGGERARHARLSSGGRARPQGQVRVHQVERPAEVEGGRARKELVEHCAQ